MKTTTILLFAFILNACGASKESASELNNNTKISAQETLNGTFTVSKMSIKNLPKDLTISFDKTTNRISGFSGCNSFFGNYTINGNTIDIKDLASTKKMCLDNSDLVESKMLTALDNTTNIEIKDNKIILLNAKKELLTATKTTKMEINKDPVKIEYRAHTRGSFKKIIVDNQTVSVQDTYDGKPATKECNKDDWNTLMTMVLETNLKGITMLEAPSKAHQYDGAPMANFSITKNGETYNVPVFDAGKPNKDIAPLVKMVLNIAEKSKE